MSVGTEVAHAGSSLRVRRPSETLLLAQRAAGKLGITRVVDITRLDRLGLPVFASVRPGGNTLCVHAGKGLSAEDAQIGAYMEAIEHGVAEAVDSVVTATPMTIEAFHAAYALSGITLAHFCPRGDRTVKPAESLDVLPARNLLDGGIYPVPAELVRLELHSERPHVFGTSSNGLASGNSEPEAVLHALLEAIERDVNAFNFVKDNSALFVADTAPAEFLQIFEHALAADLEFFVRHTPNPFNLPHFTAYLMERSTDLPLGIATGSACHVSKRLALVRAISEAAQARLTHIHGGRDDIVGRHQAVGALSPRAESIAYGILRDFIGRPEPSITYEAIPEPLAEEHSISVLLGRLAEILNKAGFPQILVFTYPNSPPDLVVVRVIVPGLEFQEHRSGRIGPRLRAYANAKGRAAYLDNQR